jgi:hypothetical protein
MVRALCNDQHKEHSMTSASNTPIGPIQTSEAAHYPRFLPRKETLRGDVLAILAGLAVACGLYIYGLGYPFAIRLRGDAYQYLFIASGFHGLSSALGYVGDRSLGMPLLDYLFRVSDVNSPAAISLWVDQVCAFLFLCHIAASTAAVWMVHRYRVLRSRQALRLLFVFLLSFPAFIGYTTTPLTDTLAVDLSLLAFTTISLASGMKGPKGLLVGLGAGFLWAYLMLLRPAYLYPTLAALTFLVGFMFMRTRRVLNPSLTAFIVVLSVLGVVGGRCAASYGSWCLENPASFNVVRHAQMGLRGGRLLWNGPPQQNGEFPVLPDSILAPRLYDQCKLDRMVGLDEQSFTGCLLRRPQLVPIYLVKKWIGLFDHFRFQPYAEMATPSWLRFLSRAYDSIAAAGFFFACWSIIPILRNARNVLKRGDPIIGAYILFLSLMLAEHTILHPEDRFSFPLIPFCALFALRLAERIGDDFRSSRFKHAAWLMGGAFISVALFVWQIIVWDHTTF